MHQTVSDIRTHFINELGNENFTIDKTGQKTIELIGASFIADEDAIFGTPNKMYIQQEIEWYDSESTNIYDINRGVDAVGNDMEPPQAWLYTANKHGEINSNYGLLIYGEKYFEQYENALDELIKNPDSRRACMVYNRPSIWIEYAENGKNDFICTNAVTYYIRDGFLDCVIQMRSNDVIFGYRNDFAWQKHVRDTMVNDLNKLTGSAFSGDVIKAGEIYWQVQNLHVYERHFDLVK